MRYMVKLEFEKSIKIGIKDALIVVDMQNDTCHVDGAYNKHGLVTKQIEKIIPNIINTINFCKKLQIPIIATQLTVLEDLNKKAIGLDSLIHLKPFLEVSWQIHSPADSDSRMLLT